MKLRFTLLGLLSLITVSCSYEESFVPEDDYDNSAVEFYAIIDEQPDADTKVYADDQLRVLWNADDRITIFNKNTYNQQYRFTGENGDNAGGFRIVKSDDEFITSNPLDNIYAVYPYRETNKISNSGVVTTSIPSEQTYKANSFGIGANTMVSVAESNMLKFKNIGGYLSLKFYGEGVSVSSIRLKSNNGEPIAGDCTVNMSSGVPVSSLVSANAIDEITLTCKSPVELGATASEATQFIFVLSPVTLTGGFTISISTPSGELIEKSSNSKRVIGRSSIVRFGAILVESSHYDGEPMGTVAEAVDLGLSVKWASWNVGASKVDDYGGLFGAGDGSGSLLSTSYADYSYNDGESICGTEYDLAHNLWGGSWRMPTREELDELFDSCTLEEATVNGVVGVYATGPNGASIFLPYSGNRQGTYTYERGSHGHYWSGDTYSQVHYNGYYDVDIVDGSVEQREGCENWIGQSIRPVLDISTPEAIDLGLSVKWASFNVGATKPEEYGDYYAWGEVEPKDGYSWSTYKWSNGDGTMLTKYVTTSSLGDVDNRMTLEPEDDAATSLYRGKWRMPSYSELQELKTKCSWQYTSLNGHNGYRVTGPNGNSIFLPSAGNSYSYAESWGCYWGSDLGTTSDKYACNFDFTSSFTDLDDDSRYIGRTIRAVYGPRESTVVVAPEAIDLGLPSGIKWASHNVGASSPEGTGNFFAWGEIVPRAEVAGGDYAWTIYKWCNGEYIHMLKYNTNPSYGDVDGRTVLEKEDDAAASIYGGFWRMPTAEEQDELLKYCTWNWTSINDVYGYEVVSKINGNSIFLPAVGYKGDDSFVSEAGEVGLYWSSSLTRRPEMYTAYRLRFANGEIDQMDINRSFALQIRPVWEELSIPEAVDLGLSVKWANMNLGALAPEGSGQYYAWGEMIPKESYEWDTYKWCNGSETSLTKYCLLAEYGEVDGVSSLDSYDDVAQGKLGGSWRMPTWEEFVELRDSPYCTWTWTSKNGVNGFEVISSITGGRIFLPAAGQMYGSSLENFDICGGYYASTLDDESLTGPLASHLFFMSNDPHGGGGFRYIGRVIRPVCD